MESIKHTQVAKRKLINIHNTEKYAPEYKGDKTSSIQEHLKVDGKIRWPLVLKNKVDSLTFLSAMVSLLARSKWRSLFPVFLDHSRWRIIKMASVVPNPLTVEVKRPDPGTCQMIKIPSHGRA